ncbi:MAG: hypothetical protein U1E05_06005 [Patescibacteria group bacterium]|nr:hypothetical protein [Patescibacteria group bacterium]
MENARAATQNGSWELEAGRWELGGPFVPPRERFDYEYEHRCAEHEHEG